MMFKLILLFAASALAGLGGTDLEADCERFVLIVSELGKHEYKGALGKIEMLADEQLCDDLQTPKFHAACLRLVKHGDHSVIPDLGGLSSSDFCARAVAAPAAKRHHQRERAGGDARMSLEDKQTLGDEVLLAEKARDGDDDEDQGEDSHITVRRNDEKDDDSDDDDDDSDSDDEDEEQVALQALARLVRSRGKSQRGGGKKNKSKSGSKKSKGKGKGKGKGGKSKRSSRSSSKGASFALGSRLGVKIAREAYKLHKAGDQHWRMMMLLHEMAMMAGLKQSPVSTTGLDFSNVDKDLYQPDKETMDSFSDGGSVNSDIGLEPKDKDDDDDDDMPNGAYDDPWLVGMSPGLAAERAIAYDPDRSDETPGSKGDLKSWLEGIQRNMLFGNPYAGIHGIGMGMMQRGILNTGAPAQRRRF